MAELIYSAIASLDGYVADEHGRWVQLLLSPVIVGGGTRALPYGVRLGLELVDERRFANGAVHLCHRVQS